MEILDLKAFAPTTSKTVVLPDGTSLPILDIEDLKTSDFIALLALQQDLDSLPLLEQIAAISAQMLKLVPDITNEQLGDLSQKQLSELARFVKRSAGVSEEKAEDAVPLAPATSGS